MNHHGLFKNLFASIFLSLIMSPAVLSETVYLASLEWAPYSGKNLKQQGASAAVAKAAFKAMGHELKIDFFPWTRAVNMATSPTSKYLGYFPEYAFESDTFNLSNSMGQSPLGIVENKNKPIHWQTVQDFSKYKLGVVQDYINTEELDALIATGAIKVKTSTSDLMNVQKVAGGRLDAAVIDTNVLISLLKNNKKIQDKVQINSKILMNKDLFVAFKNSADGDKWLAIYNQGLSKIDVTAVMAPYL